MAKSSSNGSGKRTLIEPNKGDKRYVSRDAKGKFTESDDVSRILKSGCKKICKN